MLKRQPIVSVGCALAFFSLAAFGKVEPFAVDAAHSSARFEVQHLVITTVDGRFGEIGGDVAFDTDAFAAGKDLNQMKFNLWANTGSIDTGNEKRDAHLKGEDFFSATKKGNDKITFVSKTLSKKGSTLTVTGDLTMNGVTKPVTFKGNYKGTASLGPKKKIGFGLETEIKRADWGITWNNIVEKVPAIGDTVKIVFNIEAQKDSGTKT